MNMIKSNFLLIMWKLSIDAHNNKVSIIEEGKLLLIIKKHRYFQFAVFQDLFLVSLNILIYPCTLHNRALPPPLVFATRPLSTLLTFLLLLDSLKSETYFYSVLFGMQSLFKHFGKPFTFQPHKHLNCLVICWRFLSDNFFSSNLFLNISFYGPILMLFTRLAICIQLHLLNFFLYSPTESSSISVLRFISIVLTIAILPENSSLLLFRYL